MNTPAPGLQLGIVVAVYPQGPSIDVLLPDNGSRFSNVQVMVPTGSDSTGDINLPDPGLPHDETRWDITLDHKRNIIAVLGNYKGNPICLGFLFPQVNQVAFDQPNRKISKHASDVYSTTDQYGNTEFYHPSGSYFRLGTTAAHEDLTGQDYDAAFAIKNNTTTAVYMRLRIANAGVVKATVDIDPSGNVTLTTLGGLTGSVTGNVDLTAPAFALHGPVTVNGNLTVTGTTAMTGDATIDGVDIKTHVHTGVATGGGNTGPPL